MRTDETDFPEDISELARAHGRAAIAVLAEIMTQDDAPAGARVTAAKALLERGWGKPGKPPEDGTRPRPVTKIVRRIIDPKRSEQEKPSANSTPRGQTEASGFFRTADIIARVSDHCGAEIPSPQQLHRRFQRV